MSTARHIPALDGLRGFAALIVMLSHLPDVGMPRIVHHRLGDYGVMLFFTLSGFLMGHLYLRQKPSLQSIMRYGVARAARILPLYLLVILLSYGVFTYADPHFIYQVDGRELLRLVTMTSSRPIFWSIGPEFQYYFLFPLIWIAFHVRPPNRNIALLGLTTSITLIFAVSAWMPGFSVFSKLHIFVMGMAVALILWTAPSGRALQWVATACALGFLASLLLVAQPLAPFLFPSTRGDPKHLHYYGDLAKIALCALVIYSATFENRVNSGIWGNGCMRRLGASSFSLYLLHMPTLYLAARLPFSPWTQAACAIPLSLTIAALSCRFVERPTNQAIRQTLERWFKRQNADPRLPDWSRAGIRR
jgi:peptidoglycan/LPS O-acetylase OafA/YrhL